MVCKRWKKIGLVPAGASLCALATTLFLLPYSLVVGGTSGMALLLEPLLGLEGPDAAELTALLSWGLFFLGLFTLGRAFAARTLLFSLFYSLCLSLFQLFFRALGQPLLFGPSLLGSLGAALAGGLALGGGCAMSFRGGGSTGGLDVIAFLLCRRSARLSVGKVIFLLDAVICLGGVFVLGDLRRSLFGVLAAVASALVLEYYYPTASVSAP